MERPGTIDNFISKDRERKLIETIDNNDWSTKLSRRTQHYGYEYNYKSRNTNETEEMPHRIASMARRIERNLELKKGYFNSCIINEYSRDQYISKHTDSDLFDEYIVSLSLNEDCNFIFEHNSKSEKYYVERRSLLVMKGKARYIYTHEIPKSAYVYDSNNEKHKKSSDYRRISVTYRRKIL